MRGWLLDTNIVSEPLRREPDSRVLSWLEMLPLDRAFISVLTLGEIDKGVEALREDDGRRARLLRFRAELEADFAGRVIGVEDETARLWGVLAGRYRRQFGGEAHVVDTMLVATAQRSRLYLATRNVRHAVSFGLQVFNPWSDDPADFPIQA